jgi:hypothetical protein
MAAAVRRDVQTIRTQKIQPGGRPVARLKRGLICDRVARNHNHRKCAERMPRLLEFPQELLAPGQD